MVALAALDAREVDAREEHHEVGGADLHPRQSSWSGRETVAPRLEPLVPDGVTVLLPDQELDAIGGLVAEDEDVPREGIALESFADHGGQGIEGLAEVGRMCREIDADSRRQAQHEAPLASRRSTSATRV